MSYRFENLTKNIVREIRAASLGDAIDIFREKTRPHPEDKILILEKA